MNNDLKNSDFLTFSRKDDVFLAEAADSAAPAGLAFLRLELVRVRVGMADFLMRVASPKLTTGGKNNTVVTLRCNRKQMSNQGQLSTAKVIIAEMLKRGDTTTDWTTVNADHLARMVGPTLKFFAGNSNVSGLQAETEALST